jgi:hypothetical protein
MEASPHYHRSNGALHACYHQCRNALLSWGFWLGLTVGFPIEHYLWEKVWPFSELTSWLGL